MKKIVYKSSVTLSISIISAIVASSTAYAANYAAPDIKQISPVLKSSTPVSPNIFLMLDDSGSMDNPMPYNSAFTYEIPPNPNDFDPQTGDFKAFSPMGSVWRNGFAANSLLNENYYNQNGCSDGTQNCRNFLAFYSTRMLALKSSLAIALNRESGTYSLDHDFINTSSLDSINLIDMERKNSGAFRSNMRNFLISLYGVRAGGGTPIRQQTLALFQRIRAQSTVTDNTNIFLPAGGRYINNSSLLSCKQNYSIVLSDGDYNGSLWGANSSNDFDGRNYINGNSWTWQTSDTSTANLEDTTDINIEFYGNGSVRAQRLFAGGRLSLSGDNRNRLSDIVFQAWAQDLNSSLANNVKPQIDRPGDRNLFDNSGQVIATLPEVWNPENDPANWQRIVTYTIGLGLGSEWTDASMANIINNPSPTYRWPANVRGDFARSGYVGRGGFNRVDSPQELVTTFSDIFADAVRKSGLSAASGTASSATQITTQSSGIVFSTEVDSGDRTGNVKGSWMYNGIIDDPATPEDEGFLNGGVQFCYGSSTPPAGAFAGQLCTLSSAKWSAIKEMPFWSSRNVISYNPSTKVGIDFNYDQMDTTQKSYFDDLFSPSKITSIANGREVVQKLDANGNPMFEVQYVTDPVTGNVTTVETDVPITEEVVFGQANRLINFIKGNNKLATPEHPDIRRRPNGNGPYKTPLGDFGRGGPAFLGAPDSKIWSATLSVAEKNRAFAFAGANDGMLHAFDAISGEEVFAYVPNAVYKKLENLILPNKEHSAFVDGQIATQDINNNKTILVSGMGAGAKGLFALDVTNPSNFEKDKVLWELDESTDHRIGHIFGKPSIIRVEGKYKGEDDRWVVVVGTGYGNNNKFTTNNGTKKTNKSNGILVIDALTGKVLQFLKLPGAKGLGEITWIDHQKQKNPSTFKPIYNSESYWGEMDRGYVGDLKGNVWLLDFASDKSETENTLRSAIVAGGGNDLNRLSSEVKRPKPNRITDGKPAPLFIATDTNGNRQPITTRMSVLQHPSNRGYMVYFGTGELFNTDPFQPTTSNSMYGIWDDIGDNYWDISTANVDDNNKTRSRFYLTHYPWKSVNTTFSNGVSAFARVPDSARTPIIWANFQGKGDSTYQNVLDPSLRIAPSSGWVVNTGRSSAGQYERVFQAPYPVVNEYKEAGMNFSMSTLEKDSDPCINESGAYSWNMVFRTDVIDGPFAAFTTSPSDSNRDGEITKDDNLANDVVALGAFSSDNITIDGIPLEYNPTTVQSPRGGLVNAVGAGDFCPSGATRSYKKALSSENQNDKIVEEINVCIPSTMSSWSEIE